MNETNAVVTRTFSSLEVGETASMERRITSNDVNAFAELSGDYNPLHVDEAFAASALFGKRVVHGMFLGSLVSQLVGMKLPGRYALLLKVELEFKKPAFIDDTVIVRGTLTTKSMATKIIEIKVSITREQELVTTGKVHVQVLA